MENSASKKKSKSFLLVLLIGIAFVSFFLFYYAVLPLLSGSASEWSITQSNMVGVRERILLKIASDENAVLEVNTLPKVPRKSNSNTDGWGNPFILLKQGNEVKIVSYGRDRIEGGEGDNKDTIGIFELKDKNGNFIPFVEGWKLDPQDSNPRKKK